MNFLISLPNFLSASGIMSKPESSTPIVHENPVPVEPLILPNSETPVSHIPSVRETPERIVELVIAPSPTIDRVPVINKTSILPSRSCVPSSFPLNTGRVSTLTRTVDLNRQVNFEPANTFFNEFSNVGWDRESLTAQQVHNMTCFQSAFPYFDLVPIERLIIRSDRMEVTSNNFSDEFHVEFSPRSIRLKIRYMNSRLNNDGNEWYIKVILDIFSGQIESVRRIMEQVNDLFMEKGVQYRRSLFMRVLNENHAQFALRAVRSESDQKEAEGDFECVMVDSRTRLCDYYINHKTSYQL